MTLLFFDGFDNASQTPKPEWDSSIAFTNMIGRYGDANGAMAPGSNSVKQVGLPAGYPTIIAGYAHQPGGGVPVGGNGNAMVGAFYQNAVLRSCLYINAQGKLTLRFNGTNASNSTVLATGLTTFQANLWYFIQVKMTLHASAGVCQVYVNGVLDIDYSGQTSTVTGNITSFGVGSDGTSQRYDDMWICDTVDATATQGRPNNTFLGDLRVVTLLPTGAGDVTQWTPSAAPNWGAVDESPPNTTDYVAASAVGLQDLYALSDLPANASSVYGLRVGTYAQKTDAGNAFVKPLIKQGNGTLSTQAVMGLSIGYTGFWGAMLPTKADGSLWAVADVNALQVGVEAA